MREIGYQSWSLIPIDSDPESEEPTITRPPMLTAVVLDKHASLFFQFSAPPGNVQITFETTALSGEERSLEIFRTYSGPSISPLKEIPHSGWEKSIEGMFTVFSTHSEGVGSFLKLFFTEPSPLVVNRVNFYAND
jgi:hypothetical protein